MNAQAIKEKIDNYFNTAKPGELIKEFERLGYVFVDIEDLFHGDTYITKHSYPLGINQTFSTEKSKHTACFFC
ncbi:MAG: hypothetical protein ACTHMI_11375 [Mucilaginibacter sp.]